LQKAAASSDVEDKEESEEKPKKRATARKPAAEKKVAGKGASRKRAPKKKVRTKITFALGGTILISHLGRRRGVRRRLYGGNCRGSG
jgi:hypothetical protein